MSQKAKVYEITLKPLGKFFFGGEIVFGGENAQSERNRSYLVHSRILPQQTTLLGMLREELLRQNDRLLSRSSTDQAVKDAQELVGAASFGLHFIDEDTNEQSGTSRFGLIEALSPLCLVDEQEVQYQAGPADDVAGKDDTGASYDQEATAPLIENFDPKAGIATHFVNKAGTATKGLDEFFVEAPQVGIQVSNRKGWREEESDQEAYYRQTFYRNPDTKFKDQAEKRENYAFRFWVKMRDPTQKNFKLLQNTIVQMGGERSTFRLAIKPVKNQEFEAFFGAIAYTHQSMSATPQGYKRCLLISDTYLPQSTLRKQAVFIVGDTVPFRFFSTILEKDTDFYDLKKGKRNKRRQSKRFNLLRRGSVLYVPDNNLGPLTQAIEAQVAFRTIGYNYYKIQ